MSRMQNGFLREDDGALMTISLAGGVGPYKTLTGFLLRDANNRLSTYDDLPGAGVGRKDKCHGGYPSTQEVYLSAVEYALAVGPLQYVNGLLWDANGKVVTVTRALAVAPLRFQNGHQRDVNNALVVT